MPLMPVSYTACSPASRTEASTSARALSTTSSIRPGWMRPSVISRSRASRPTSRRTGSKHDTTTVSGVSSMMTSTPVAASNARIFRPSRPMIRPFISSEGRATADTVVSAVDSGASRWIAKARIFLASLSALRRACSFKSRARAAASLRASSSSRRSRPCFASWAGRRASCPSSPRPAAQLEAAGPLFQAAESLLDELLVPLDVAAAARGLFLEGLARLHQLLLRGEDDALSCFPQEPLGLRCGRTRRRLRRSALHPAPRRIEQHSRGEASAEEGRDHRQPVRHRIYLQHRSTGGGASVAYI